MAAGRALHLIDELGGAILTTPDGRAAVTLDVAEAVFARHEASLRSTARKETT